MARHCIQLYLKGKDVKRNVGEKEKIIFTFKASYTRGGKSELFHCRGGLRHDIEYFSSNRMTVLGSSHVGVSQILYMYPIPSFVLQLIFEELF